MSDNLNPGREHGQVRTKPASRQGFTIGELLLVIAIVALVLAFLLPFRRTAGPAAQRVQCMNNLKQIALALHNYEATHGALPPAYSVDSSGRPLHSWRTLILPWIEQEALYRTIDLTKPWNDPVNARALGTALPVYRCPESIGPPNATTYLAITGPNGCLLPNEPRPLAQITDPHGWTLMVIEAGEENAVPWMAPVDADESLVLKLGPATKLHHAGGTNASSIDARVRFLKADTPARDRRAMLSISGGDDEILQGD